MVMSVSVCSNLWSLPSLPPSCPSLLPSILPFFPLHVRGGGDGRRGNAGIVFVWRVIVPVLRVFTSFYFSSPNNTITSYYVRLCLNYTHIGTESLSTGSGLIFGFLN